MPRVQREPLTTRALNPGPLYWAAAAATASTTAPMGAAKPLAMPVIPLPGPPPFPAGGTDVRLHRERRGQILVAGGDHR